MRARRLAVAFAVSVLAEAAALHAAGAAEPQPPLVLEATIPLDHVAGRIDHLAIALGDDADNVRIDPRGPRIIVGYGAGGLAIIEPTTGAKLAEVPLAAHPEGFQLDPITGRI